MKELSDSLNQIVNGYRLRVNVVSCHHSKVLEQVLVVLTREGFIRGFFKKRVGCSYKCYVLLKYVNDHPCITFAKMESKSGFQVYKKCKDLRKFCNGLGVQLLSTRIGIITNEEAFSKKVGGKVLFRIY